ncbi:hypothetical protein MMC25_001535 [Agyrium rufum]|nr:hypothetical protein [Agyrium rufum]
MSAIIEVLSNFFRQSFFLPKPTLTEENLPDQTGKVFIVTGGYTGCGYELTRMLYEKNGTIYVAGRSPNKGASAIEQLKKTVPNSKGRIEFLKLDLADLSTIKASAEEFISKEERLDVLTNNAGVMVPPSNSFTPQVRHPKLNIMHGQPARRADGVFQEYDLQLGTNCLGPFLFTQCLLPVLRKTAASAPAGSVRVTWAASGVVENAPSDGVVLDAEGTPVFKQGMMARSDNYSMSKVGNVFYAEEFAKRYGKDGIVSLAWNPGNLETELQRHTPKLLAMFFNFWILFPAKFGAYTELWAGWSPEITMKNNGKYVWPWGRIGTYKSSIVEAVKSKDAGGKGSAESFWYFSEKATRQYM